MFERREPGKAGDGVASTHVEQTPLALPKTPAGSNSRQQFSVGDGFCQEIVGAGFHGRNEVLPRRIVHDDQRVRTPALPVGIGDLQQP